MSQQLVVAYIESLC